jgi:Pyridoxamine 5'-phosphate oxidase
VSAASRPTGSRPPHVERPSIPDYGVPESLEGTLPWSWAEARLREALTYWISTSGRDGRPHAAPVWAVWLDGRLWFEGGLRTRRARDLAGDPRAVAAVHVDDATALIVEGVVETRTDPDGALAARLVGAYGKYRATPWAYEADPANWRSGSGGGLWALRPTVAFGWSHFPEDATRWRWDERAGASAG